MILFLLIAYKTHSQSVTASEPVKLSDRVARLVLADLERLDYCQKAALEKDSIIADYKAKELHWKGIKEEKEIQIEAKDEVIADLRKWKFPTPHAYVGLLNENFSLVRNIVYAKIVVEIGRFEAGAHISSQIDASQKVTGITTYGLTAEYKLF